MSPQEPSGKERRKSRRVKAKLPVELTLSDGVSNAHVHDISLSGVRCITDRAMPVMTHVQLVLMLPGNSASGTRKVACEGAVVRSAPVRSPAGAGGSENSFDTAIFFTRMGESGRAEVEEFLALRQKTDPSSQDEE